MTQSARQARRPAPEREPRPGIERPLRLLYLVDRNTYLRKMSRVRFHSMAAIGKVSELVWSGPGWDGYDERRTVDENIQAVYAGRPSPDLVIGYKPLDLLAFGATSVPKCVRYNEMYDVDWTWKEMSESRANLVVCHHRNDRVEWDQRLAEYRGHPLKLVNVAHCAEQTIYRDYGEPARVDLLLVGALGVETCLGVHYPLRERLAGILASLSDRYRCEIHQHPGYDLGDASSDRNSVEYARALSAAKICLTCSGAPKSRFGKYPEIAMCGTALAADVPDEDPEFFREFLIELDPTEPDDRLRDKLVWHLEHDDEREHLARRGLELASLYTQERYAERFVREATLFLAEWRDGLVP